MNSSSSWASVRGLLGAEDGVEPEVLGVAEAVAQVEVGVGGAGRR